MLKAIMTTFGVGIGVAFIIGMVIVLPFLSIWAFNTLFPTFNIPYTLETWAAAVLLGMFFRGASSK
jgi:hypothetical protein